MHMQPILKIPRFRPNVPILDREVDSDPLKYLDFVSPYLKSENEISYILSFRKNSEREKR